MKLLQDENVAGEMGDLGRVGHFSARQRLVKEPRYIATKASPGTTQDPSFPKLAWLCPTKRPLERASVRHGGIAETGHG